MNGPGSFFQGEVMATKVSAPLWSEDDIAIARQFLEASRDFSGTFQEKKDRAADSLGYRDGYMGMPEGVRRYISHLGQTAKVEKKNNLTAERINHNLAQMKKDWEEQYANDPDFHHAMTHPDDEER